MAEREEAEPGQGVFVSYWRPAGRGAGWLPVGQSVSRLCLCQWPPPTQPCCGCWSIPQPPPSPFHLAEGGASPCSHHPQAGRAVLQGSIALEEEEIKTGEISKQGFPRPVCLNTALHHQRTKREVLTFDPRREPAGFFEILGNPPRHKPVCCPLPGFMAAQTDNDKNSTESRQKK